MKKIFDLSDGLWLKVPILFYILGFLVHNLYMAKYNFSEFDLWQSKYILSGVVFAIFILLIFLLGTLKSDVKSPINYFKKNLPTILSRVLIFSLIITSGISSNLVQGDLRNFLSDSTSDIINVVVMFLSYSIMTMILIDMLGNISDADKKFGKYVNIFLKWASFPLLALFILIAYFNSLLFYVFIFFIIVLSFYYFAHYGKLDADRGVYITPLAENVNEETQLNYGIFTSIVFLIIGVFSLTYFYSRTIYPNLPVSIGGAKPYEATIIYREDSLKVTIIGESKDWIIFQKSSSSQVERIKNQSVNKILIENN